MSDARARRRKAAFALVAVLAVGVAGLALWMRSRAGDAIPSGGHGGGGGGVEAPAVFAEQGRPGLAPDSRAAGAPAMVATLPVAASAGPVPATDLPTWKDVRFALVDAVTGMPLDGSAVLRPPSIMFGRGSEQPRSGAHAELWIEAAPGFVAAEPRQFEFAPELATTGVSVVFPLHRAIDLEVTVLDAAGNAVLEAELRGVMVGNRPVRDSIKSSGPGRFLLRRLPFEPRGPLFGRVSWHRPEQPEPTPLEDEWYYWHFSGEPFTVRMPEAHAVRFEATLHLDRDRPLDAFARFALEAPAPAPPPRLGLAPPRLGTVRVRARRRDGSLAVGALIWWAGSRKRVCDADGVATLQWIDVGRQSISLADPRLVPITVPVEVRVDETTEVDLVEPDPAMLDVTVVDAEGKGIPVARVEVVTPSGMPALDLVDGVLRLDPYTDEFGRRTFTRVEPGSVTVRAWGRGGMGEAQLTLRPGLRSAVTVVVK